MKHKEKFTLSEALDLSDKIHNFLFEDNKSEIGVTIFALMLNAEFLRYHYNIPRQEIDEICRSIENIVKEGMKYEI